MNAPVVEKQYRCVDCGLRLGDYENAIEAGLVTFEIKCRKCGASNRLTLGPKTS